MAVNFDRMVLAPGQDMFGQKATFYPVKSQPTLPFFRARGVLRVEYKSILTESEGLITSKTINLSVRESEFHGKPPIIGDELMLPNAAPASLRGVRMFVEDRYVDGQGAIELTLGLVSP